MFVDGNLLDEVPALDADLLLGEQVLDDHVRHVLPERVPEETTLLQISQKGQWHEIVGRFHQWGVANGQN